MKHRVLSIKTISICAFLCFSFFIFSSRLPILNSPVHADSMESSQYQMKYVNINSGADVYSSATATLSATLGQLAAEEFSSSGYIIKAGFQYFYSIVPFTFSISRTRVDFGEMTDNVPATQGATLSVSFGGAGQYQVTASENGPLKQLSGPDYIPDTSCDDGTCNEITSRPWVLNSTEGFGYSMSGDDIPTTFVTCGATCYRRFADTTVPETPQPVMSSQNVTVDLTSKPKNIIHQSDITFKLNVGPGRGAGTYQTVVNFIATPSY